MKILLIEDDQPLASVIRLGLKGARYTVDTAEDGPTGLRMAQEGGYGLIILDIMLPGMDGWSLCAALREQRVTTPILILTARDAPEDRVRGFELGADDYLAKPFHFPELLARVQALFRHNQTLKTRVIRVSDLEIDTTTGRVSRAGRPVALTAREYWVLETLAANAGKVLSCQTLGEQLQDSDSADSLQMDIESLREKIDSGREAKLISAAGSVGYVLDAPEAARETAAAA